MCRSIRPALLKLRSLRLKIVLVSRSFSYFITGQAIFLVNDDFEEECSTITLAYEFLPYPEKGQTGTAMDRSGKPVCEAEVISLRKSPATDGTALLTIAVPKEFSMKARAFRPNGGDK